MEKYYCKDCKYHTNKTSNFKKHMLSQNHSNKSNILFGENDNCNKFKKKIYCCDKCNKAYTSNRSLQNHICNAYVNNDILKKDAEISELKQELKSKDAQLHKALDVAVENSKTTGTTMNILKYAKLHLTDAEPLEQLEKKDVYEVINYNNPKNTEIKNEQYVKIVIHKFNHGIFADFVGNMILEHYKPKKTKDANLITSDMSRLCFIIMQKVNKKGKVGQKEWINDKSGKRFTELVLHPLTNVIKETLVEFLAFKKNKEMTENLLCLMGKCVELKRDIEVEKFTKPILRHVAPSFHFDNLKLLDDDDSETSADENNQIIKKIKNSNK